ncbi:porin [Skermanella mucosa]|uniref:porin n=1 Tax=Skermanella mucosa TaxID=1789672 RepID=UPI00192BEF8A|nr:porin [Skermanella mucosa]UEM23061.1 porin [Skermanella mucosa]
MKKILLGTTAIAAAALYAQAAQAQITVSLGGYTEFFGAYYDDDAPGRTSREFQLETEIVVRADGKADNGLLYGAKVELQNSSGANAGIVTDEASVYLGGTWGRIELGDFDGAADTLAIYAPLIGIEQLDGDAYDFLDTGSTSVPRFGAQPFFGTIKAPDSGDSTKVMYLTPRFAGIQAGVSYATQNGNEGQSVVAFKEDTTYRDFFEFGANYTGTFAGFSVALGATGSTASGEDAVGATELEDFFAWQAGAQVGYAGFKFGGGYIDGDDFGATAGTNAGDASAWHVGASYTAGPFAVGISYADAEGAKGGFTTYTPDYKTYGGGFAYTLAPGFIVQADLMFVDEDVVPVTATGVAAGPTVSNEGYVAVLSTRLNF